MAWTTVQTILNFNRRMSPWKLRAGDIIYQWKPTGAVARRISPTDAERISTAVKRGQIQTGFPMSIALAFMGMESRFDPNAMNMNGRLKLGAVEGSINPDDWDRSDKGNWDVGVSQLKLKYLAARADTGLNGNLDDALELAQDIDRAVQVKFAIMRENVVWARRFQSENPKYQVYSAHYLALLAYNSGRTGAEKLLETGGKLVYADRVMGLEREFALRLGIKSVFG